MKADTRCPTIWCHEHVIMTRHTQQESLPWSKDVLSFFIVNCPPFTRYTPSISRPPGFKNKKKQDDWLSSRLSHCAGEISKRCLSSVHTNLSRKRRSSKTFFKPEEFENAGFSFSSGRNTFQKLSFPRGVIEDDVTIVTWFLWPSFVQTQIQTDRWLLRFFFFNSSGLVWTEPQIKGPLSSKSHAVVCLYFESLYCLNAWSDWLNVTHSIILNWKGEIICIFCTSTIFCHCKTDTELHLTAYVHPCSLELTFGATGIPQTCLSVLSSKPRECFLPLQRLKWLPQTNGLQEAR